MHYLGKLLQLWTQTAQQLPIAFTYPRIRDENLRQQGYDMYWLRSRDGAVCCGLQRGIQIAA